MVTLFEFLSDEPIDNIITCMNYRIDRVIFFGYQSMVNNRARVTRDFLSERCGILRQNIRFSALPAGDLPLMLDMMRAAIGQELKAGNRIFFDITGGDSLILVAFGKLSDQYHAPIHLFDVPSGKIIELEEGAADVLSRDVERRTTAFTLSDLIRLHGGIINTGMDAGYKHSVDTETAEDIEKIWKVASAHLKYWNPFSMFLRDNMIPDAKLTVSRDAGTVIRDLKKTGNILDTPGELNVMLDALAEEGLLLNVRHADGRYQFTFKNEQVRKYLWDGGSVLEIHAWRQAAQGSNECRVGVHIDWDGIIHQGLGNDVLNEIDVLALKEYIPVFISCKSGKMDGNHALYALYELQTVADRFGGKYARKVLVSAQPLTEIYIERAQEMGIEIK